MAIIFEGTFADLQARLHTLDLPPEGRIRLESQDAYLDAPKTPVQKLPILASSKTVADIIEEQDEEEVSNACRIAGYQYPDRAA